VERLTIDELARRAGLTTRNVRAYQERGLLPPPVRVGRVGYYDERHLARLSIVGELLERGYSLASIRELIDAWEQGGDLGQVLGFEKALARPFTDERPVLLTAEELTARFGDDPEALRRAVELRLVVPEEGGFLVPSMQALDAGGELLAAGIPLDAVLEEAAALQRDTDRIAGRFVDLLFHYVWQPFVEAGMPADQLPRITEIVERLRPVAAMAVMPALADAMGRKVKTAVGSELAHVAKGDRATA
jgi:DNA-binding transcriptional MerR regulator